MLPQYPMLLGGRLHSGAAMQEIRSPASSRPFAAVAWANAADADAALDAARDAFPLWSRTPVEGRVACMASLREKVLANGNELREIVCQEVGKTWAQSEEDVQSLADSLAFYAETISSVTEEFLKDRALPYRHELRPEPLGVVVAFLAWNFPLLNLGFKLGPALAAGCSIVIKPSPKSPVSAYFVGRLCLEAGIPPGVVNIICGTDSEVSARLACSEIPSLLTLIGSSGTARKIMSAGATSVKRYSLELGGNAPVLVFADADLERAAETVAALKFGNAGQICVAPNRVFVQTSVKRAFADLMLARARSVRLGSGKDPGATMGPVIDGASALRLTEMVDDAVSKGAKVLAGGRRAAGRPEGSYFEPTVVEGVEPAMWLYDREVFGPVVSLVDFDTEDQAVRMANDTDTGLVAYVFTSDQQRAERCVADLRFGEVQVNGARYAINLPHGGIKQSGVGHDCSTLALRDYLAVKRVSTALASSDGAP